MPDSNTPRCIQCGAPLPRPNALNTCSSCLQREIEALDAKALDVQARPNKQWVAPSRGEQAALWLSLLMLLATFGNLSRAEATGAFSEIGQLISGPVAAGASFLLAIALFIGWIVLNSRRTKQVYAAKQAELARIQQQRDARLAILAQSQP